MPDWHVVCRYCGRVVRKGANHLCEEMKANGITEVQRASDDNVHFVSTKAAHASATWRISYRGGDAT
jgi:hypothetical protein